MYLAEAGLQLIRLLLHQYLVSPQGEEEDPILDTDSLLHAVRSITRFVLYGSNIQYEVNCHGEAGSVRFRCNSLLRIFLNLLTNAVEAMPAGGRILIAVAADGGAHEEEPSRARFLKISIKDQGPGIPEEVLPHIFTPGFSTRNNGRGLGLAFCREVVTKNGGRLEVVSTVGAGTTFTIRLPTISAG